MAKRNFDEILEIKRDIFRQSELVLSSILKQDGTLKYDFMISLKTMSMVKIVCCLWMSEIYQQQLLGLFHNQLICQISQHSDKWQKIIDNVLTGISTLPVPKSIVEEFRKIVLYVANLIYNWIEHHDECVFHSTVNSKCSDAVGLIKCIKWTTRGNIDYEQTSKNILANRNSFLTDEHRYKLACTYCLEDEINIFASKFVNSGYLNRIVIERYPMVYFWTAKIINGNTKSHDLPHSINKRILHVLAKYQIWNEIAIKYLWNKLTEEEKCRNVAFLITNLSDQDFKYSLISNLSYEQQVKVFEKYSDNILGDMFKHWLWGKYFLSTALHVLDIMEPCCYSYIIELVVKESILHSRQEYLSIYNQYTYIFKLLWINCSKKLKETFLESANNIRNLRKLMLHSLSWERDVDIIELIINDLNTQQKKSIIFEYYGVEKCADFIEKDQWNLLEMFFKYTLSSEDDVSEMKRWLVGSKGRFIVSRSLDQNAYHRIEYFLKWAFKSHEEIKEFKCSFAYSEIFKKKFDYFLTSYPRDFTDLDNHFKWCSSNDSSVINQMKGGIPSAFSRILIYEFINNDKYELIDIIFKWCFSDDQIQVENFKNTMYNDRYISSDIEFLFLHLTEKDDSFELLDKFTKWCFTTKEYVKAFKSWILYNAPYHYCICAILLKERNFELANKFIDWCEVSCADVAKFKTYLIFSKEKEYIFNEYDFDELQRALPSLIKWFNPSENELLELRKFFVERNFPQEILACLDGLDLQSN